MKIKGQVKKKWVRNVPDDSPVNRVKTVMPVILIIQGSRANLANLAFRATKKTSSRQ
jgi:hypothetical protein